MITIKKWFMKNRWFPMLAGCVLHCLPASANAGDAYQFPFFPAASDRGPWQKVLNTPSGKKQAAEVIARAEKILSEPVPPLPASVFMRFRRKWNRIDYETLYFQRRHNMHTLVLAECMEYQGRFIDKIIDYLWEITSEHTWNLPAHLPYHPDPLPFLQHEHIAL